MSDAFIQYLDYLLGTKEDLRTTEERDQYLLIERIKNKYIKHISKPSRDKGYSDLL